MKLYTRYTVFIKTYFLFWIHCNNLNQIWMGMVYKDFLSLYRTTCPPFLIFIFLNTSMNSVISVQTFIRGGPEEHIRSSILLMSRLLIRLLYNYIKQTDWSIIWFSRHVESIPFIFTTKTKLTSNNVSSYSAFHTFPETVVRSGPYLNQLDQLLPSVCHAGIIYTLGCLSTHNTPLKTDPDTGRRIPPLFLYSFIVLFDWLLLTVQW